MEYRRRRHKRRAASSQKGSGGASAKVVVVLLIVAAVVYVISVSQVGTWIAEKVFAPIFETVDGWFSSASPIPDVTGSGAKITVKPTGDAPASASMTDDIEFPALECYALQMGVYSDKTNADAQASALRQRGAGGYVMEDAGRYRVLAAVYSAQDSLKQVREQLQTEGIESATYTFTSPSSTLRITASQEQIDGIVAGFHAFDRLQKDMAAATLAFDKQHETPAAGREKAAAMLAQLRADAEKFNSVADVEHPVLSAAKTCFQTCEDALSNLMGFQTDNQVDFSSQMKYTHIKIVEAYTKLSKAIMELM